MFHNISTVQYASLGEQNVQQDVDCSSMVAIFAVTAEVVFCVCCQCKSPKHTSLCFTVCIGAVENEGIVSKLLLINQHVRATLKLLLESKCTS